jgi:fumarate reductase flavoprotein subunit
MALAYRAGAPLKDLEFVQYHPTCLPETGILITEAARGEGGILVNRDGYRYLQDYGLGKPLDVHDPRHPQLRSMELGPRDWLSQAFIKELEKGRTIAGPHGEVVHLDIRFLGERKIDDKLPFIRELCRRFVGIDPVRSPIPVRPAVHYMMGGIHIDSEGATPIPGLYAAGECACASLNGANRLGSNSLPEILVFGSRAARAALRSLDEIPDLSAETVGKLAEEQGRAVLERFGTGRSSRGSGKTASIAGIRYEMNAAMEAGAGIYRDEGSLKKTCDALRELRERYGRIRLVDSSRAFSTELTAALELGFMLDVSEALAHSALARKESRGSHQRTDHQRRDDVQFLKHTLAYRAEGAPRIEYLDVVITRWPPGERKYGA